MKRWLRNILLTGITGTLVLLAWLWFSLFSPWGYVPPPGLPPIAQDETHQVFAYGTLRQPLLRWLVVGRWVAIQAATLYGFRQQGRNVVALAVRLYGGRPLQLRPGDEQQHHYDGVVITGEHDVEPVLYICRGAQLLNILGYVFKLK